jgi:hypothetical protein
MTRPNETKPYVELAVKGFKPSEDQVNRLAEEIAALREAGVENRVDLRKILGTEL